MASNIVKRQRQKRRIDQDGDPEFQVAPMVDVLLVLMLFFMAITSTEVLKKDKNLKLAEANHAKPQDKNQSRKTNEVILNVSWNNETAGFTIDGMRYATADDVQAYLANRYHQNPQSYVLIRADQNVEYSSISDIMTACAGAGIGTVSFAVITNPANATPAPGSTGPK